MNKLIRVVTSEEFSDHVIHGLLLVECEDAKAWMDAKGKEWMASHLDQSPSRFSYEKFYEWLLTQPEVSRVDFEYWWMGSYGDWKPTVNPGE